MAKPVLSLMCGYDTTTATVRATCHCCRGRLLLSIVELTIIIVVVPPNSGNNNNNTMIAIMIIMNDDSKIRKIKINNNVIDASCSVCVRACPVSRKVVFAPTLRHDT